MRKLSLLAFLVVLGCDSERPEEAKMSASFNGREWSAVPQARLTRSGQLQVVGTTGPVDAPCPQTDPCERLLLVSNEVFNGPGTYSTGGDGDVYFLHADGDLLLSGYTIVDGPPTFDVVSYDPGRGEISGRFQMAFALEFSGFRPGTFSPPDTIRFESGRFVVPLSGQGE